MAFRRLERELSTLTEEDEAGVSSGEIKNRRDQGNNIKEIITNVVKNLVKIVRTHSLELVLIAKNDATYSIILLYTKVNLHHKSLYRE